MAAPRLTMTIAVPAKTSLSWWQTAVATVAAYVLFIPALLVVGIVPLIYRMWIAKWLHIEETNLSLLISFFQYHIATCLALFFPVHFLKRANAMVAGVAFGGPLTLLFLSTLVLSGLGRLGSVDGFGLWDMLVSTAGVVFGAGSVAYQERHR
jgi:hypothetical protein